MPTIIIKIKTKNWEREKTSHEIVCIFVLHLHLFDANQCWADLHKFINLLAVGGVSRWTETEIECLVLHFFFQSAVNSRWHFAHSIHIVHWITSKNIYIYISPVCRHQRHLIDKAVRCVSHHQVHTIRIGMES